MQGRKCAYLAPVVVLGLLGAAACSSGPTVSTRNVGSLATSRVVELAGSEQRYAVVVGIGDYKNGDVSDLRYTRKDAEAFYGFLVDEYGANIPVQNVLLLVDESATRAAIEDALLSFLSRADEDDFVMIYYAGHGATGSGADAGQKYLVPHDCDPADLPNTAVPMSLLQEVFSLNKARSLLFIADACYSGGAGGRTFTQKALSAEQIAAEKKLFEEMASAGQGRVIVSAADANEPSLEFSNLEHGVFTFFLLEGLKGFADSDRDNLVTLSEIYKYAFDGVQKAAGGQGLKQTPVFRGQVKGTVVLRTLPQNRFQVETEVVYRDAGGRPNPLTARIALPDRFQPAGVTASFRCRVHSEEADRPVYVYLLRFTLSDEGARGRRLVPDGLNATANQTACIRGRDCLYPDPRATGVEWEKEWAPQSKAFYLSITSDAEIPLEEVESLMDGMENAFTPEDHNRGIRAMLDVYENHPRFAATVAKKVLVNHGAVE